MGSNSDATRHVGHPIFAAAYARMARGMEASEVGAARRALLTSARGVVVDLGSGVGLNLRHLGPEVTEIHAVEPDPHMVARLIPRLPPNAVVHQVGAESLPLPDASADTVLATLTLCTVQQPDAVVAEIRRVLRPGGQVLVLEHVLSLSPRRAAWQHRLRTPWQWFGGGCQLNRDTAATFAAAGFDTSGLKRIRIPGPPVIREWITGTLYR